MFSSRWVLITLSSWILFQLCLRLENWFLGSSICFICETHLFYVFLLLILIPHSVSHIKEMFFLSWTFSTWKKRSPEHFFSPFYSLSVFLFLPRLHMNFFFSPESFLKCFPRLKNKQMRNLHRLWNDFKHREKTKKKILIAPQDFHIKVTKRDGEVLRGADLRWVVSSCLRRRSRRSAPRWWAGGPSLWARPGSPHGSPRSLLSERWSAARARSERTSVFKGCSDII